MSAPERFALLSKRFTARPRDLLIGGGKSNGAEG
jgi:hypothetical protein